MRTTVIYLLFIFSSINLHAMEVDLDTDLALNAEETLKFDAESNALVSIDQPITTLSDAKQLVKQLALGQKKRGKNGNSEIEELEIPDNLEIDPQVFIDYAAQMKFLRKYDPGCLTRLVNSCRKNLFTKAHHGTPLRYKRWSKQMLNILCYKENQEKQEKIKRSRFSDEQDESDWEEESDLKNNSDICAEKVKILQIKLKQERREKTMNKKLNSLETKLHQELRNCDDEDRETSEKWLKRIELACTAAGIFLATYFGG